jgi:hypothetical protein
MEMPTNSPEAQRSERRIRQRAPEKPTLFDLRAVFHRLWGSQVGQPGYSKRDWREIRQQLFRLFKVEV